MLTDTSVFLALYALMVFWLCFQRELEPFRVGAKFLCVKGVIFFSFWQGLTISILVSSGIVSHIGSVVDDHYLSPAMQDTLICWEMPLFAVAHVFAFSYHDFDEHDNPFAARLPVLYALRDSFGIYDVIADLAMTHSGASYNYRTYEPSDTIIHHPFGLERRSRAGLRYAEGGRLKYWVEEGVPSSSHIGEMTPLVSDNHDTYGTHSSVHFDDLTESEEALYEASRRLPYGDYYYAHTCI